MLLATVPPPPAVAPVVYMFEIDARRLSKSWFLFEVGSVRGGKCLRGRLVESCCGAAKSYQGRVRYNKEVNQVGGRYGVGEKRLRLEGVIGV